MLPFVVSTASSPLAPVTLMSSLTEFRVMRPFVSLTMISPWIDFAVTVPDPPLMTMSPLTVSAETSFCTPSMPMYTNWPLTFTGSQAGAVMS
jgi:hypothetical protein